MHSHAPGAPAENTMDRQRARHTALVACGIILGAALSGAPATAQDRPGVPPAAVERPGAYAGDRDASPEKSVEPRDWSLHGQLTGIYQGNLRFGSPFQGPNSLDPGNRWRQTVSATAYVGRRLWDGA